MTYNLLTDFLQYNISFSRIYRRRGFFMLDTPSTLQEQLEEYLRNKPIPNSSRGAYKKWLRYYRDFCRKYNFPPICKESLPHFIRKLQEKKQAKVQQEQAAKAITLYYEILTSCTKNSERSTELSGECGGGKSLRKQGAEV